MGERVRADTEALANETDAERRERIRRESELARGREAVARIKAEHFKKGRDDAAQ